MKKKARVYNYFGTTKPTVKPDNVSKKLAFSRSSINCLRLYFYSYCFGS